VTDGVGYHGVISSTKIAIHTLKRAICTLKTALRTVKRALHTLKRALNTLKRALHTLLSEVLLMTCPTICQSDSAIVWYSGVTVGLQVTDGWVADGWTKEGNKRCYTLDEGF